MIVKRSKYSKKYINTTYALFYLSGIDIALQVRVSYGSSVGCFAYHIILSFPM